MAKASVEREILLTGRRTPRTRALPLRAGPLRLELDGVDLRSLRHRGVEVSERIYVAVRDADASNVPGIARHVQVTEGPGPCFEVRFVCRHEIGDGVFEWAGRIDGTEDGLVTYRMDGVAETAFEYPRLGLCVLHGAQTYAGSRYRSWLRSSTTTGVLPVGIGPQIFAHDRLHGLLPPFERLELEPLEGLSVTFEFQGDQFQMEDQRNFGDSTFKTYSTPIEWVGPYHVEPGQKLSQSVAISVRDTRDVGVQVSSPGSSSIRLGAATTTSLPPIGLSAASDGVASTESELRRVADLGPAHIRAEIMAADGVSAAGQTLALASAEATGVRCGLWVDLLISSEQRPVLGDLATMIGALRPSPDYVFVSTPELEPPDSGESHEMLLEARSRIRMLSPMTIVGVGAQRRLAEINRWSFDGDIVEALSFPLSPTVHLSDDATMLSNLGRLGDSVASARVSMRGRNVFVGPISLATRHGPYPSGPAHETGLPPRVDPRQVSLLAAAWTVGCISGLAHGSVDGLTIYETAGWLGVTERDAGPTKPAEFLSVAGSVFPIWHVLADACEWRGGQLIGTVIARDPEFGARAACLAVRDAVGAHLLVSSLLDTEQEIVIEGAPGYSSQVRVLDETTAKHAMSEPLAFRDESETRTFRGGSLPLRLKAYATVRLDLT
jgi:hypothetical protein